MLSFCRRKVCKRSKWLASCTKLGAFCTPIEDLLERHDRIVFIPMGRLQGLAFSALWWRSEPLLHQRLCTWAVSLTIMAFQRPEVATPASILERRFGLVIGAPKGAKSLKGPHSSFREKENKQERQQRQRCRSAGGDRRRAHDIASVHTPSQDEQAQQSLLRSSSVPADFLRSTISSDRLRFLPASELEVAHSYAAMKVHGWLPVPTIITGWHLTEDQMIAVRAYTDAGAVAEVVSLSAHFEESAQSEYSGFNLADGSQLRLGVFDFAMPRADLYHLGGCSTGTPSDLLDCSVLKLLPLGPRFVVTTMWSIADVGGFAVGKEFIRRCFQCSPPQALQAAQMQLSMCTLRQIEDHLRSDLDRGHVWPASKVAGDSCALMLEGADCLDEDELAGAEMCDELGSRGLQLAAPFWWAAFRLHSNSLQLIWPGSSTDGEPKSACAGDVQSCLRRPFCTLASCSNSHMCHPVRLPHTLRLVATIARPSTILFCFIRSTERAQSLSAKSPLAFRQLFEISINAISYHLSAVVTELAMLCFGRGWNYLSAINCRSCDVSSRTATAVMDNGKRKAIALAGHVHPSHVV